MPEVELMAYAGHDIPNEADVGEHSDQSEPDSFDFKILHASIRGTGVIEGCAVTGADVDMEADIAAGTIAINGKAIGVTAGSLTMVADGSNPRFTLIYVNSSGTLVKVEGTPHATNPVFPAGIDPQTNAFLAAVYVANGETTIANANITDKRCFVDHKPSVRVWRSTTQTITTGATGADISFDTQRWDDGVGAGAFDMWDASDPTKLFARVAGRYWVYGNLSFETSALAGQRQSAIRKNGGTLHMVNNDYPGAISSVPHLPLGVEIEMDVGDYVTLRAVQATGSDLDVQSASDYTPVFGMRKVGDF
jgi:hypothetical protein